MTGKGDIKCSRVLQHLRLCFPVVKMKYIWRELGEDNLCLPFLHFFQIGIALLWREYCSSLSACRICCSHWVSSVAGCQLISSTLTSPAQHSQAHLLYQNLCLADVTESSFSSSQEGEVAGPRRCGGAANCCLPPQPSLWVAAAAGLHFMQKLAPCCCSCSHCLSTAGTLLTLDTGN